MLICRVGCTGSVMIVLLPGDLTQPAVAGFPPWQRICRRLTQDFVTLLLKHQQKLTREPSTSVKCVSSSVFWQTIVGCICLHCVQLCGTRVDTLYAAITQCFVCCSVEGRWGDYEGLEDAPGMLVSPNNAIAFENPPRYFILKKIMAWIILSGLVFTSLHHKFRWHTSQDKRNNKISAALAPR